MLWGRDSDAAHHYLAFGAKTDIDCDDTACIVKYRYGIIPLRTRSSLIANLSQIVNDSEKKQRPRCTTNNMISHRCTIFNFCVSCSYQQSSNLQAAVQYRHATVQWLNILLNTVLQFIRTCQDKSFKQNLL